MKALKTVPILVLLLFMITPTINGQEPTKIIPVDDSLFIPVETYAAPPSIPVIIESFSAPKVAAKPIIKIKTPAPKVIVKPKVIAYTRPSTKHSVRGRASWYCKAGVSVCHHSYPPGSMVAAACGKLRASIGTHWRGKVVTVTNASGKTISVKLVDWCGSTDKLIDLYWEPMRRLGGTGVLPVTVRW